MAFTDVETEEVRSAINTDPKGDDLCKLGLMYSTGQCGEVDFIEAHKWFNLAAMMGSEPAKHYRREVSMEMASAQIAEAQRAARDWLATRH
ncbi:SEL1-like repeat protein [Woodsholea maritima]|uniref:SEL1-like repeat protein n=1 Tax=Woodsholea maritima TaxID=240237 RepID=UPI0003AB2F80|nr:SEL1-like repeat protein [Woodsholea maritima]